MNVRILLCYWILTCVRRPLPMVGTELVAWALTLEEAGGTTPEYTDRLFNCTVPYRVLAKCTFTRQQVC
jgi:hypothetical protein